MDSTLGEYKRINQKDIVVNSFWKLMESFVTKGVSMIVSIILARLLLPEYYGLISLTTVVISFSDVLVQAGFSSALIQRKSVSQDDISTVFTIGLITSSVIYLIIFFLSPFIASYYNEPTLVIVLRVLSLSVFLQAFGSVRTAFVSRNMKFKALFIYTFIANLISGLLGIILAYIGCGVWALVWQQLSQQIILNVVMYFAIKMKVHLKLSKTSIKEIVPFSLKVLTSSMLSFLGDSVSGLAIGKIYSLGELGIFDKGAQFPRQFSLYTFGAISGVFLPVFSSYKDDYVQLHMIYKRVLNITCFVIFPFMVGLFAISETFVLVVLTSKWLSCVKILKWFCLYYAVTPIMLLNIQLLLSVGRPEVRIKSEVIRMILLILSLVLVVWKHYNIETLAAFQAIIQLMITLFLFIEVKKCVSYQFKNSFKEIFLSLIISAVMGMIVKWVKLIQTNSIIVLLCLEIVIGVVVYLGVSFLFKHGALKEVLKLLKK